MEEERKKEIFQAIGIETVFIIVLILIIVGVLSYLNIIPAKKYISQLPFLPQDSQNQKIITENINPDGLQISVTSQIPGYLATLNNKELLEKILKDWGIIGATFEKTVWGSTASQPIKQLKIILTNQPQRLFINAKENNIEKMYSSTDLQVSPGMVTIRVFMGDVILNQSNDVNANIPGNSLAGASLRTLYHLVNPPTESISLEERTQMYIQDMQKYIEPNKTNPIFLIDKL